MNVMTGRFQNRIVVITGAGQGIGRAVAERFAREGACVGLIDRNPSPVQDLETALRNAGADAETFIADVSDTESVSHIIADLATRRGRIDVLVNNAGVDRPGAFLKLDVQDFLAVWSVHFLGTVNCCRAVAPHMLAQGAGAIVNVSSIYGKIGAKGESAYCSVKAGLVGLTKSLAKEWGSKGVRVNAVLPGLTDTPTIRTMPERVRAEIISQTALGRWAEPEEIASAIAFLASEDASFITGAALEVSGGWSM
jgi:3-oxoacyl-[acyl-carrier protein] reductase